MFDGASSSTLDPLDDPASGTSDRDAAPRSRDSHRDMSSALAAIEARIEEIEREMADVFEYLARHPGSRAGEVAAGLGVGQGAVSARLYRGKGRLFVSRAGRWYPVPAADSCVRTH
jgi:DNA-directed RNA polymerase specialized sigma24 family protein